MLAVQAFILAIANNYDINWEQFVLTIFGNGLAPKKDQYPSE